LPRPERVRLAVYDIQGRHVRTLANEVLEAGSREFAWDSRDENGAPVGAGIYLIRLETLGFSTRRKIVLVP
jgi:flagellar hook assembly protein FlgD